MAIRRVGASISASDQVVTKAELDAAITAALGTGHGTWVDHTTNALAIAAGFTSTTDFRIDTMRYIVLAKTCWWWCQATRLTATYTAPANGDATNIDVFGFPAGLRPTPGAIGVVQGGSVGSQRSLYIQPSGLVRLTSMAPTSTLTLNTQYDFSGAHPIV